MVGVFDIDVTGRAEQRCAPSQTCGGADLAALPPVRHIIVRARAEERQRVPRLTTTALHGALSLAFAREDDSGGRAQAYLTQPAPFGDAASIPGINDYAPTPLVIAPEHSVESGKPMELREGDPMAFRVTLIGARAAAYEGLVARGMKRALLGGLGVRWGAASGPRPRLLLESIETSDWTPPGWIPECLELRLLTPVRLKAGGKIAVALDAQTLWGSMARRLDALSRLYGGGALFPEGIPPCPFRVERADTRVVSIGRYSSRQRARMEWPGLVGRLLLAGPGLPSAWPFLLYGSATQIGKGTSFGFGRYALGEAFEEPAGTV